jgi:hypothetical protein
MKFEIHPAKNGIVLTVDHGIEGEAPEEIVYQEVEGNEVQAFADFLHFINDNYGPSTSRYSPQRIYITIEPGDKWEGDSGGPHTEE